MRVVSTRFITGTLRSRDMYNWTPMELDEAEVMEPLMTKERKRTAERVRRYRLRQKMLKNSTASVVSH